MLKRKFFVFGESYGGHFAPVTAHRIWLGNKKLEPGFVHINLAGFATGNGLTQPSSQYRSYPTLAFDWCKTVLGKPCVSHSTYLQMKAAVPTCLALIKNCNSTDTGCAIAAEYCNNYLMGPFEATGRNVYDIRKQCVGSLCYPMHAITSFLNRADVQKSLGVRPTQWTPCSMGVNQRFESDWMHNFVQLAPPMLADGVRFMIYSGTDDFIVNFLGSKFEALAMNWTLKETFAKTPDLLWYVDTSPAGQYRTAGTPTNPMMFSFVTVFNAGHMVPMDAPRQAVDMVRHFINNQPFDGTLDSA